MAGRGFENGKYFEITSRGTRKEYSERPAKWDKVDKKATLETARRREDAGYELPGHYEKMKEHLSHDPYYSSPQKNIGGKE